MTSDSPNSNHLSGRIRSIDIFRALTMVGMIWVNDFWTLTDIPTWLKHMPAEADSLGFSDIIFPAFLFIVGLSIPFAINKRNLKDGDHWKISWHILIRGLSLVLMGVFMVNLENINGDIMIISKIAWQVLMVLAFFLIWNQYPNSTPLRRNINIGIGVSILIFLGIIYQGGAEQAPTWMKVHWWGILGLIGWAYMTSAFIFLITNGKLNLLIVGWIFFLLFNVAAFAGMVDFLTPLKKYFWIVGNGAFAAFTMGGVVVSSLYLKYIPRGKRSMFAGSLICLTIVMMLFGFITRPEWGISKIRATPAWIGICTAIPIFTYLCLYWLSDLRGKVDWANFLSPAGYSTLTCYLVPYFYYALVTVFGLSAPAFLSQGLLGLLKSLLIALFIVMVTGSLNGLGVRLRL